MNFQYPDDLDCEFLHSNCELKETVFSLNENNTIRHAIMKRKQKKQKQVQMG